MSSSTPASARVAGDRARSPRRSPGTGSRTGTGTRCAVHVGVRQHRHRGHRDAGLLERGAVRRRDLVVRVRGVVAALEQAAARARRTRRRCRRGRRCPRPRRSRRRARRRVRAPSARRSTASISSRVRPGLRFGLSRQRSVVTTVPAPSSDERAALAGDARRRRRGGRGASASRAAIVGVPVEGGERAAPAGELEAERVAAPVGRLRDHRTGVAQPGVVDRLGDDLDARARRRRPRRGVGLATGRRRAAPARTARWRRAISAWTLAGRRRAGRPRAARGARSVGHAISVRSCGSVSAGTRAPAGSDSRGAAAPDVLPDMLRVNHAAARAGRSATEEDAAQPRARARPAPAGAGTDAVPERLARSLLRPGLRRRDPDPELGVLARRATSTEAFWYGAAFVSIWWVWLATTMHANRFPHEDVVHRSSCSRRCSSSRWSRSAPATGCTRIPSSSPSATRC